MQESPECPSPRPVRTTSRALSRLCDRVLHHCKRFGMALCLLNADLQGGHLRVFGGDYRFDVHDMRQRYAIRSIEANINQSLCARSMGHSLKMHEQTYHRELQGQTLRVAMAKLSRNSSQVEPESLKR